MRRLAVRFLLDQGIALDAASMLRSQGFHCEHVSELGMARAADSDILRYAESCSAVVVSLDADSHAMVAISRAVRPSVVRIRQQGCGAERTVRLLLSVVSRFEGAPLNGALVPVKGKKTTCHRLPVGLAE